MKITTPYKLMMPIGQFGVGCHLDGGRAQCRIRGHQGGRQGGGTGVAWDIEAGVSLQSPLRQGG